MTTKRSLAFFLVVLLLVSLACGISFGNNQSEADNSMTQTLEALKKTVTAIAAESTAEPAQLDLETSPEPVSNDAAAQDDQGDDTCNQSKFVSENIPDGSMMDPGEIFTKAWFIRNNGTCEWTTGYRLVFEDGDQMDGPASLNLERTVSPGETYSFEIDLTAPDDNGSYTGVWRIKSDDGNNLGKYWVKITVGSASPPPPTFAVTRVNFYMPHTTIDMACTGDIGVQAEIITSDGGVVSFKWEDTTSSGYPTKSLNYASAGSKIISHTMTISSSGDYWAKLYIDAPNHQWFGPINFHVNCTP